MIHVVLGVDLVRDVHALVLHHVLAVVHHELVVRGERASYGSTRVNLLHHGNLTGEVTVAAHTVACEVLDGEAALAPRKAIAADGLRHAAHVPCLVRQARLIWHLVLCQVLVDHPRVTTIATRWRTFSVWGRNTVRESLPSEHHVRELAATHDLDPVVECGCRAVDPASAAILWDVLIPVSSSEVQAVHVAPIEGLGQSSLGHQLLRRHGAREHRPGQPWPRTLVTVVSGGHTDDRADQSNNPCQGHHRCRTQSPLPRETLVRTHPWCL
mmetsp:Transcript_22828/g.63562  ORF Transcript_22828/g.63562 Transcript_22828/m.63562 type:complete len:269 (+) Transcript_22828:644-1450(+)